MSLARQRDAPALLFFLCFFVVFASGRLGSFDAGQQLRVSVLLALTGSTSESPERTPAPGWQQAANGRWYQAHDIGNPLLMLPAAWIGGHLSTMPVAAQVAAPPIISRVGVSLTCAGLAAVACFWLFRLFSLYTDRRAGFFCALAFPCSTIFLAYARAAWDVLGACCLLCGALYYSAAVLRGTDARRSALLLAGTLAAACSFRYSLAPFMAPAALYVLLTARRTLGVRTIVLAACLFGALMLPSFWYNYIRTGSLLRPGTATAAYLSAQNGLQGDLLHGLYSLFLSPNRGIFLFSPVLLVMFALPFVWPRLATDERRLLAAYGAGSLGYVLLVSKIAWGTFGWGPRHLVPILPVLFAASAFTFLRAGKRARLVCIGAAGLSAVLTVPSAVVNWQLATTTWAEALNADAARPYQQAAAWRALAAGVKGTPLPVPVDARGDELRETTAAFPDLMLARLARRAVRQYWGG